MKIGIVTWFRYENYGTVLQAMAMQKFLNKEKQNVEFLNFELEDGKHTKKKNKINLLKKLYFKLGGYIYRYNKKKYASDFERKSLKFRNIVDENCNVSNKINTMDEYIKICNEKDILIFGSDQIWNPNWYHPFYFGNNENIKTKLVAYAPSFGVSEIKDNKENIKNAISRFSSIALREETGCNIVENLLNKKTKIVLDPTLLLNAKEWEILEEKPSIDVNNYILCYMLSDNPNHWKAIKRFAKKNKKQLVVVPHDGYSYMQSKYVIRDCSVGNFLYLIKNADYIVTDSFHGTVFSIIYNKDFCVFERHNPNDSNAQNSRIYNLLKIAKSKECLINYNSNKIEKITKNPNYYKNLEKLINDSKEYLKTAIM